MDEMDDDKIDDRYIDKDKDLDEPEDIMGCPVLLSDGSGLLSRHVLPEYGLDHIDEGVKDIDEPEDSV